jgi:hypothetical protein
LVEKIDAVFTAEREKGIDPHVTFALGDGKLTVTNLTTGTSLGAAVVDLKRQLARTGKLPRAFESERARQLISA